MKLKKLLALVMAGVMALAMTGCGADKSDSAYITDKGTLVVGYTIINPLNYMDDEGNLTGFETEFAQAVAKELGVKAEFVEINWDAKETELNSKNIDCIWNGMTITPERAENMSISTPYLENRQVLVVRAEDAEKYAEGVGGAKVVAESGSAGEELVTADEAFATAEFTPVQSMATALMEVKSGTADVAVIDYVMAGSSTGADTDFADLTIIDNDYESEEYGIAFRKGSDVTEKVNAAITKLMDDGTLIFIADKYGLTDILIAQ